jgi:L-ribulose-5-phosphate 4-epimerase
MLQSLKKEVWAANLELVTTGLVIHTWGNASGIDRKSGQMVIKPSGVAYDELKPEQMVVVALDSGRVIEGTLKPSSDTATHLELYRAFQSIGGIAHTHSLFATAWAQSGQPVPALGTTHADYFHGPIPCTRLMSSREIDDEYEAHTGRVIVESFSGRDPLACPAVLVAGHGPFAWGKSVKEAVHHAVVLEHVVRLAGETLRLFPSTPPMQQVLLNKHFFRKHGPKATYGQERASKTTNSKRTQVKHRNAKEQYAE